MSFETAKKIVKILDDKKAQDITVIDIQKVSQLADYFVICSGTSSTHVKALADEVEYKVGDRGSDIAYHKEGYGGATWVLLDYRDVIVHIFHGETRDFYNLEHLWVDGDKIDTNLLLGD
ncbi:MAG: ribosome silencing factor [Clostridiaceae bacterium]|jgi:ribosome-associated protein|nr:ribosome silencing factor [Clostridiaceae bacterium]